MPLNPSSLPKWLTDTPDPSGIIGRGSAAGGQAADARLGAERLMAQREQFAAEFTLKQAQLDQDAEKAAQMMAQRDQELEIRRTLAESEVGRYAVQAVRDVATANQRAKQAADKLRFDYEIAMDKNALANKEAERKAADVVAGRTLQKTIADDRNTTALAVADKRADAKEDKPDTQLELLRASFAESQAQYTAILNSDAKPEVKLTAQKKVEGLAAKLDELEKQRRSRPTKVGSLFDQFLNFKKEQ